MSTSLIEKAKNILLQSFPLTKTILLLSLIYFIGIAKGAVLYFILSHLYIVFMRVVYGLEPFASGDKTFVFRPISEQYNLLGYLILDNQYDIEEMKKAIINRGIKVYKRLRSVNVYKHFDFWWKELPLEDILTKHLPFDIRINTCKFETKKDMINYSYDELNQKFDIYNELPYKFIFIQNNEGMYRNLVIFKADHILSDGVGFVGLLSSLAQNYDVKLFPQSMKKKSANILGIISSILLMPYYAVYNFYRNLYSLNMGKTPFKSETKPISGIPKISLSKEYSFSQYSKINKRMGITFNDMMMAVFSSAIKRYCDLVEKKPLSRISVLTPISLRALPKDAKNLVITNDTTAIGCELPLVDSPLREVGKISKEFKAHVRNMGMYKIVNILSDFCNTWLPYYCTKNLYHAAAKNFDITFSNVAFPKEPLVYAGCNVTTMYPVITTGLTYVYIGIYSYNGNFNVMISVDSALDLNPDSLMDIFDKEMNVILERENKHKKHL